MSRFMSKLRRAADSEITQDIAALLAMVAFLVFAIAGSAAICIAVSDWRLVQ